MSNSIIPNILPGIDEYFLPKDLKENP